MNTHLHFNNRFDMRIFMQKIVCYIFIGMMITLSAQENLIKSKKVNSITDKPVTPKSLKIIHSLDSSKSLNEFKDEEPPVDRIFRKDLILQLNEIIKKIQHEYPLLSKKLTIKRQKDILKSFVSSLNRGIKYVSPEELPIKPLIKYKNESLPAIMLASNKILYIRINSFSKKTLNQLKKDCANFAKKTVGIIIDLRNSHGNDYNLTIHAIALFLPKMKMQQCNLKSSLKQTLKQPVIILTGIKTTGTAEVFCKIMMNMKRAISIGAKSAGVLFKNKKFTLSNGDYLLIPQIPQNLNSLLNDPIKPSILFTPYPQLNYKKLQKIPKVGDSDKCIQRAVELILCLNALKYE